MPPYLRRHSWRRCRSITASGESTVKFSVWMTVTSLPMGSRRAPVRCASISKTAVSGCQRRPTPWQSIVGIKGEVTLRRQPSLGFHHRQRRVPASMSGATPSTRPVAWFSSYPKSIFRDLYGLRSDRDHSPTGFRQGHWVTLGFMHDGFGTMELYADGQVVARRDRCVWPGERTRRRGPEHRQRAAQRGFVVQRRNRRSEDLAPQPAPGRRTSSTPGRWTRETAECWRRFRRADRRGVPAPSGLRQADRQVGRGGSRRFHSPGQRSRDRRRRAGCGDAARRIQSPVARVARSTAPRWWRCSST